MDQHKITAKNWLEILRNGTSFHGPVTDIIRRELDIARLSLAAIGTSEDELKELRIKGCKISAMSHLKIMRRNNFACRERINCLRDDLKEGGVPLDAIGTSEEELSSLFNRNLLNQSTLVTK